MMTLVRSCKSVSRSARTTSIGSKKSESLSLRRAYTPGLCLSSVASLPILSTTASIDIVKRSARTVVAPTKPEYAEGVASMPSRLATAAG